LFIQQYQLSSYLNPQTRRGKVYAGTDYQQTQGAEVLIAQGSAISIVCKKIGVSDYTYYRWRKEYGGMRVDQAHRLKELEQENSRLNGWSLTFLWIILFLKKLHRETPKPVP